MTTLLLLLLSTLAWAQGPDQVSTPQLVFDSGTVTTCTGRKAVAGVAFCNSSAEIVRLDQQELTDPTIPDPVTTTVTTSTLVTTTTTLVGTYLLRYVRTDGDDTTCDGTQDEAAGDGTCAWKTIDKANETITLGTDGTIVYVGAGSFAGPTTWTHLNGTASKPVRFVAQQKWQTSITSPWVVRGAYNTVEGFYFNLPARTTAIVAYTYSYRSSDATPCVAYTGATGPGEAHHVQILDNFIENLGTTVACQSTGAIITGTNPNQGTCLTLSAAESGYNVISRNIIRRVGNPSLSPTCNQMHGIYPGGSYTVVTNNIVSGVGVGWGIHAWGDYIGQVIANNTVFNNKGGVAIGVTAAPTQSYRNTAWNYSYFANNIIVNNGVDFADSEQQFNGVHVWDDTVPIGTRFANNVVYGNRGSNWLWLKSTRCADCTSSCGTLTDMCFSQVSEAPATTFAAWSPDPPMATTTYAYTNYDLRAGSGAVDGGTTACPDVPALQACIPTVDIESTARPVDAATDIGAFEFDSSATTTTTAATTSTTTTTLTQAPDWSSYLDSALLFNTSDPKVDSGGYSGCWASTSLTQETGTVRKGFSAGYDSTGAAIQTGTNTTECADLDYTADDAFACGGWVYPSDFGATGWAISQSTGNNGFRLGVYETGSDMAFEVGNGTDWCKGGMDDDNVVSDTWSFIVGVYTSDDKLKGWVEGSFRNWSTCSGTGCTRSGTTCSVPSPYLALANTTPSIGNATYATGRFDDFFCDDYSATPADDGVLDDEALCRILACGITGAGCQCSGATYATGTGAGTDYALYGNGCTLPDCNQARP